MQRLISFNYLRQRLILWRSYGYPVLYFPKSAVYSKPDSKVHFMQGFRLILSFPCLRTQLLFFFSALRDLKDISSERQDGRATWFQNRNCRKIDCKQENAMYKKLKGKALENYDTFLLTFILKKSFDKCSFIATTFCLKS